MSDLDVRAAARKEARRIRFRLKGHDYPANRHYKLGFEDGAVWAAGCLPTRDEVAAAIASGYDAKYERKFPVNDHDLRAADAVLALIANRDA